MSGLFCYLSFSLSHIFLQHQKNNNLCCFCPNNQSILTKLQLLPQSRPKSATVHFPLPQTLMPETKRLREVADALQCTVCVFVRTPTVSGIWRIGTVIWAALRISHKQMKAQSLKVRLISLSELHREYSEYGEGFLAPRGAKGRFISPLLPTSTPTITESGGKMAWVHLLCSSIFTHSSCVLAAEMSTTVGLKSTLVQRGGRLKLSLELK